MIVCDPNEEEEQNSLGYLILGTNNFKEVTAIHITGKSQIIKNVVLKCCTMAWERTNYLMEFVKKSLADDKALRTDKNIQNNEVGFVPLIKSRCSGLFTFRKESVKQIEIEDQDQKEANDEFEFSDFYLTKMYRFQSNTDAISDENMDTVKSDWKNGTSELLDMENVKNEEIEKMDE